VPSSEFDRGPKLAERLARVIARDITKRGLKPGDRLMSEATMTSEFGIGRASVREALRILEGHGLITIKTGPSGGPVVAVVDARSFGRTASLYFQYVQATADELIDARLGMETMLAGQAADRWDEADTSVLRAHLEQADAVDVEDWDKYRQATDTFHSLVSDMSGNRILSLFGGGLASLYRDRVSSTVYPVDERRRVVREHRRIGQAILAGKRAEAEILMREHLVAVNALVRALHPTIGEDVIDWI
jgi:GntR family transcriptional regulator, transcriptional repressor for pyruvate dehydrogenase complex